MSSDAPKTTPRAKFRVVAGGLTIQDVRDKTLGVDGEFEIEAGDRLDVYVDPNTGCFVTCVDGEGSLAPILTPLNDAPNNEDSVAVKSGNPPTPLLPGWTYVLNVEAPRASISEFIGDEDFVGLGDDFVLGGDCGGPDVMD